MAKPGSGKKAMSAVRSKRQKAAFSSLKKTGAAVSSGARAGNRWAKKVTGGKKAKARTKRPAAAAAAGVETASRPAESPAQKIRGGGLLFVFGGIVTCTQLLPLGVAVIVAGVILFAGAQVIADALCPPSDDEEDGGPDGV